MHFWRLPWAERNAVLAEIHAVSFSPNPFPQTIETTLIEKAVKAGNAAMFCAAVRSRRNLELTWRDAIGCAPAKPGEMSAVDAIRKGRGG